MNVYIWKTIYWLLFSCFIWSTAVVLNTFGRQLLLILGTHFILINNFVCLIAYRLLKMKYTISFPIFKFYKKFTLLGNYMVLCKGQCDITVTYTRAVGKMTNLLMMGSYGCAVVTALPPLLTKIHHSSAAFSLARLTSYTNRPILRQHLHNTHTLLLFLTPLLAHVT